MRQRIAQLVQSHQVVVNLARYLYALASEICFLDQKNTFQNVVVEGLELLSAPQLRIWNFPRKELAADNIIQQLVHEQVSAQNPSSNHMPFHRFEARGPQLGVDVRKIC